MNGISAIGNMMSKTGVGSYDYNVNATNDWGCGGKPHSPKRAGGNGFCYDQNGNMIWRYEHGQVYRQDFNADNKVVAIDEVSTANWNQSLGRATTFSYDADGVRVKKTDSQGTTISVGDYEATTEITWVDDSTPEGASLASNSEGWTWNATSSKISGSYTHESGNVAGMHQHYFDGATRQIALASGDVLYAWVWLDASSVPNEVMLQWSSVSENWNHRAYWGANAIPWGTNGTSTLRNKGALPPSGQWVKLEVTADEVGLVGKTIKGMAFTLNNGHVWWDKAGVRKASPAVTKYYRFGGQRVAMRSYSGSPTNTSVTWLHGDHLGSASTTSNGDGVVIGEMRYTPPERSRRTAARARRPTRCKRRCALTRKNCGDGVV